jgi:hypothetical protein
VNKTMLALVHFVPAGMLAAAIGRWPYEYYMILRVMVFAAGLLAAALIYQRSKQVTIWVGLFVIMAIVFNPIIPVHLRRGVWSILNVLGAGIFFTHWVSLYLSRPNASSSSPS